MCIRDRYYRSLQSGCIDTSALRRRKVAYRSAFPHKKYLREIPHVTNAIKDKFRRIEEQTGSAVVITELGGTIGDIESQPFVEAITSFCSIKSFINRASCFAA